MVSIKFIFLSTHIMILITSLMYCKLVSVSLSERLSDTDSSLQVVVRDLEILSRDEIPGLIQESLSSQVSHILTGDYNLKLARQDYFISNQDQVKFILQIIPILDQLDK